MRLLNLTWLLVNMADVTACVLSVLVLRQKEGVGANRYLYWFFVGQVVESSIAALSVMALVIYPTPDNPAIWFSWLRVSGRAIKSFFVWTFTLYLLNVLSPDSPQANGRTAKMTDAITPVGNGNKQASKPLPVVDEAVVNKLDEIVTPKLNEIQDTVNKTQGEAVPEVKKPPKDRLGRAKK